MFDWLTFPSELTIDVRVKPNGVIHGQNHTEAALRSHLERYGVHVERATELRSFEQHPDHVIAHIVKTDNGEVEETVRARWLVGADGARGMRPYSPT